MAKSYDAIVIGGGHNGLVNAAYLARAGKKVLVLERRHVLGGAAVTEELYPGFKFSVCSYVVSLLRPEIIRDLDLPRHGLEIIPLDCSFTPLLDGNYLARWGDKARTRQEILRHSRLDAEAYERFGKLMFHMAMSVKPILSMIPPDPTSLAPGNLLQLYRLGKHFQGLGEERFHLLYKMMTMGASDFLDQWFESPVLKGTMSCSGIIGTFLGPRSPGSAYVMLHHYMGEIDGAFRAWGFARGGTGAISNSIAAAARELGAEIRTEAPCARLLVKGGKAAGVVLESGEEIRAKLVVSSLDPRRTFLQMVEPGLLDDEFVAAVKRFRFRGSSGKVNLAVDRLPSFSCHPGPGPHLQGDIAISPSVDYLERAYDDAKYGGFSRRPFLNVVIPTTVDPSMAPPGQHVISIFVQYANYHLAEGTWEQRRDEFGDAVVDTLAEYCPGLKESILYRQVLSPWDLEQEFGLTEGNIFQGELTLEQLFFLRPVAGWAQYRTPIGRYYACGSGTHPGGGIMGAAGKLAAQEILKDLGEAV
ncbi:MAG TPA: NAD(P)/FAD-dependent oxidoreductase [Acidobacteriota bacterium]